MELLFTLNTDVSLLGAQVTLDENTIIVFLKSYFLMDFVIDLKCLMILKLSYFPEIIFFEGKNLCKTSRSSCSLSVELTEE